MSPVHSVFSLPRVKVTRRIRHSCLAALLPLVALSALTAAPAAYAQTKPGKKATTAPPKAQKPPVAPAKSSDQSGNQKGLNFTAVATPEAPVPGGFYTNSYAIIIGISHYKDASKNLEYAAADAEALAKVLTEHYDFPAKNITKLTNEEATRENIEKALAELEDQQKYTDHTRVVIFFSGHGQTVKDKAGIDKGFLIPYDAEVDFRHLEDESSYMKTCLRMDTVWGYLTNSKVNLHALLIADACYGGLLVSKARGFAGAGDDADRPSEPVVAKDLARNALEVLTAGSAGEPVMENSEWGHGAFTYKLLEMLRARASKPNDVFLASQLATALETSVGNLTKGRQTPQFGKRDSEGDVVFYTAGASAPVKAGGGGGKTASTSPASPYSGLESAGGGEVGASELARLAGAKLTVQLDEDLHSDDVQQGAEVRFRVKDDVRDAKGQVIADSQGQPAIPAQTLVIGHVTSKYKAVAGGNLKTSFMHYGQDSKIAVSCDYILMPSRKISLQPNERSIGGSAFSSMTRIDLHGKRDRTMKKNNTFIDVKISDDPMNTSPGTGKEQ